MTPPSGGCTAYCVRTRHARGGESSFNILLESKAIRHMHTSATLTRSDIENAVTPEYVRLSGILRIALVSGVTLFYLVIIVLSSQGILADDDAADISGVNTLSMIHGVVMLGAVAVAVLLSKRMLRKERLNGSDLPSTIDQALQLYRTSSILLIAPMEGGALFGGVVILMAAQSGLLESHPVYWINALSAVLLLLVGLLTFPTRERIVDALVEAFGR